MGMAAHVMVFVGGKYEVYGPWTALFTMSLLEVGPIVYGGVEKIIRFLRITCFLLYLHTVATVST